MGEVVKVVHAVLACHMFAQIVEYLRIVFEQLQREVTGGVVLGDMFIGLQVFLNMGDTVFNLMTIVDVQVARCLVGAFINLDDGLD